MKKVKIFLASSIEDLREDRLQVGDFFRQLNEIYLDSGVHFSLIKCEDYDNSLAAGGKQQEYDREIRESELVFFLFFRKVGDYTKHEFEVALESFKDREKPKIITYFKYITSLDEVAQEVRDFMQLLDQEIKHYYNTYNHIDTLKLGILMQIKLMKLDNAQIKLEDGRVHLNGQPVVKAENVPLLYGNRMLRELTEKRRQLQAALDRCRSDYNADSTPENEDAFFNARMELKSVSEALKKVEKETMELLTTVAEMTSDGQILTYRMKEALKHFNQGDYAAVLAILGDKERENELRRAQLRAEIAKNEIQGYVEEELLSIQTKKAQGLTEKQVEEILDSYRKVAELVEKHDLDKTPLYDYAVFLYEQNRFAEAISVAEKLRWYYANPSIGVKEEKIANLYNLLGLLYKRNRRNAEAAEAVCKAFEIYSHLAARNPEAYEADLADCCNILGFFYRDTKCNEEATEAFGTAFEIFTRLANQNPEVYGRELAGTLNNLGAVYFDTKRYEEAEEAFGIAFEIFACLSVPNQEAYGRDLAMGLNNLGMLYCDTGRYEEAETIFAKAMEIKTHLTTQNPGAYEPDLAGGFRNLGVLYRDTGRYEEAEKAFGKAMELFARLAVRNPEAYEPDLAICCDNLGSMYRATRHYKEAEKAFGKAVELYTRLAIQDPETYERKLALCSGNLANCRSLEALHSAAQCNEKAEGSFNEMMKSIRQQAVQNLEGNKPKRAKQFNIHGMLNAEAKHYRKAEEAYGKAVEIYTGLAVHSPETYEPYLADTLWNLFELYAAQNQMEKQQAVLGNAQPLFEKLAQKDPERYQERVEIIRNLLSQA